MATDLESRVDPSQPDGMLSRAALQLRQFMCGLHGHDPLMHFDHGRISLLCASCGHETPGWDVSSIEPSRPETHQTGSANDASRVVRMPLIQHRRVA